MQITQIILKVDNQMIDLEATTANANHTNHLESHKLSQNRTNAKSPNLWAYGTETEFISN